MKSIASVRGLLTFMLMAGLLLNAQALPGACGDRCAARLHPCAAAADGSARCPLHRALPRRQKAGGCCPHNGAAAIPILERTSSQPGDPPQTMRALPPGETAPAAGMQLRTRGRPAAGDGMTVPRDADLPLRI
jgi:hypothetical protein